MTRRRPAPAVHPAALHVAKRLKNYTAMLARAIVDPDLDAEARGDVLTDISRLAAALDGDGQRRLTAVFDELDNAVLVIRVTGQSLDEATDDAIEGLHYSIGPADAQAIDRAWFKMAIVRWPDKRAGSGKDSKYEAVEEAIKNTSFAMKRSSIKTRHTQPDRKPPAGRRNKKRGLRK